MALDNEFRLQALCLKMNISACRVFELAADECCFTKSKASSDFEQYLRGGSLPRYVTMYVKKNITSDDLILWENLIGRSMWGYAYSWKQK
jgi:hypothetical protein